MLQTPEGKRLWLAARMNSSRKTVPILNELQRIAMLNCTSTPIK
jgi:hypothetical protein